LKKRRTNLKYARFLYFQGGNMTIAFDFDGVIHKYSNGWQDGAIYDEISREWFSLVRLLLKNDHHVFILTTRPKRQIYNYFRNNYCDRAPEHKNLPCYSVWGCGFGFRVMPFWEKFFKKKEVDGESFAVGICNHKAVFDVLVDDRTICFTGSFDGLRSKIENFIPWGGKL